MPHIHEKIDYVVDVYIVEKDAVLLRFHEKYNAWLPPGGHIELDEGPEEAALREVLEETGLPVTLAGTRAVEYDDNDREVLPPRFLNRHHVSETHEHIAFVYFARAESRELAPRPEEQDAELRWFTRNELEDAASPVWERVRAYALSALAELAS